MLEFRVFTSFQKSVDKVPHNKELKLNSLFNGKDKSILNNFDTTIFYLRIIKQA